ncbi:MAG: AAA family ATPase [Deltaproteobacteria bacterium]|nr:AAA family ATPase [Deltaproteobacteria bacterium]
MSVESEREIQRASQVASRIFDHIGKRVVGQAILRRRLIEALITGGHILLEGVPGVAKTLSIKCLASAVHGSFKRIQFTPDLLPSDLIGTEIFRPQDGGFEVRKGPVFAHFVLADEINRAPAKVQSALLEIMQEHQVTIGRETFRVPDPFLVLATQNPIEQEGTYPLPEAQIDRFFMKVKVDYPRPEEELEVLDRVVSGAVEGMENDAVCSLDDILSLRKAADLIYVDSRVKKYIVDIVWCTREPARFGLKKLAPLIELGASPRSSISLYLAARAEALLNGENFVVPQNVKDIAEDVLRHRVVPSYEAEAEDLDAEALVKEILAAVPVP